MNLDKCSEVITYKKIVLVDPKGGKSKFCLINEDQIKVIKVTVDGCLNIQGNKCDFLLKIEQPLIEIYVELKGSDVEKALEQLLNTIRQISSNKVKILKYCYIIQTRCPQGTEVQKAIKQYTIQFKKYNATLKTKTLQLTVNLKDILPN